MFYDLCSTTEPRKFYYSLAYHDFSFRNVLYGRSFSITVAIYGIAKHDYKFDLD